jgi:hypothetical protein
VNDSATHRPLMLTLAAVLVGVEGLVLVVLALLEVLHIGQDRATMGVSTSVFFALLGAGLLVGATGLVRLVSWARSPVVLAQLMMLGLAWNFREGGTAPVSVTLTLAAVVVLVGVLSPSSTAALREE